MASELQRLSQAVEKLTDQVREDLRNVDRSNDALHDDLRDVKEQLDRIESRLRRADADRRDSSGPVPIIVRDSPSQPNPLAPDTQPTKIDPFDDGKSGITADREKIVLRWEFLGTIWRWGRWGLLPAMGAGIHHIWEWLTHFR